MIWSPQDFSAGSQAPQGLGEGWDVENRALSRGLARDQTECSELSWGPGAGPELGKMLSVERKGVGLRLGVPESPFGRTVRIGTLAFGTRSIPSGHGHFQGPEHKQQEGGDLI